MTTILASSKGEFHNYFDNLQNAGVLFGKYYVNDLAAPVRYFETRPLRRGRQSGRIASKQRNTSDRTKGPNAPIARRTAGCGTGKWTGTRQPR